MKIQYMPHGNETVGVIPANVDPHDHWRIPPRFCSVDDPECGMILTPGQYLTLHEVRDRHWIQWMRSHDDFVVVNRARHPDQFGG